MNLRPATHQDSSSIRTLVHDVLSEYGLALDPHGTDADLDDIERSYFAAGGFFAVLEDAGQTICGTVGIIPLRTGVCELRKMYLVRSARGKGLGRMLLEHAIAQAHGLGFCRMELETAGVLKEAIGLYTRYGFKPLEGRHLAPRCNQAFYRDLDEAPMKQATFSS